MIEQLTEMLQNAVDAGSVLVFVLIFLGGVMASFTPCTYPVLPLTVGYIGNAASGSRARAFFMSLTLVLGMSVVYAVVGMFFAAAGGQFGSLAGDGLVMYGVGFFFVLMALFLLDVFTFPVPRALQKLQGGKRRDGMIGAFMVGAVSGLVVGPCTGPILAIILGTVVATLDAAETSFQYALQIGLGGFKLFLFGLGQGTLIILAGVSTSLISKLPKAGTWMVTVKKAFAVLVLAGASLIFVYVGQNTDFPNLTGLLAAAEAHDSSTAATETTTPGEGAGGETPSGNNESTFGGDEFLE